MEILSWIFAGILIVVGVVGVVLPALPGTMLVFAGLFLAAWLDGFTRVGMPLIVVLGVLSLLSYLIEAVAVGLGTKLANASREAFWGAILGTILGVFTGFFGLIFLPFLGAFLGELLARRRLGQAAWAGFTTWVGLLLGTAARLALAFLMIGLFILGYIWPA